MANELLEQVKKSPAAVAVHDKRAWMSIFAKYHVVEDPVGSTPHVGGLYDNATGARGDGALSRFFDCFIQPNKIGFDVQQDVVCGNHVVRDLNINIEMSPAVKVTVPMHLLYELTEEDGEWKIQRLAAHWELMPMMGQLFGKGFACAGVLTGLTVRMLKLQGIGGMLGFSKAVFNIGNAGKTGVHQMLRAINGGEMSDLMSQFESDAACVYVPYGDEPICPSQVIEKSGIEKIALGKILAAGDTVTASVTIKVAGDEKPGVLMTDFNRKTKKITSARFYFDQLVEA
ncbi:Uncharacterised protein [BD1-7 clade bacterium]|uniref:SnoaL-like domain-containing protein n=1 Tax=BD1-7 clade bacterium TaxID=2029982 RepID=A0A5S9N5F0_9GAMM|nr:Uncharacterised protein [BD1-7 clade bacterium]CAA0084720.1 Uncharacterised protein [BD1-7 clade bacterium]